MSAPIHTAPRITIASTGDAFVVVVFAHDVGTFIVVTFIAVFTVVGVDVGTVVGTAVPATERAALIVVVPPLVTFTISDQSEYPSLLILKDWVS